MIDLKRKAQFQQILKRMYWADGVQLKDIIAQFGLGPSQACDLFKAFRQQYDNKLIKTGHTYRLRDDSKFMFSSKDVLWDCLHHGIQQSEKFYLNIGDIFIDPFLVHGTDPLVVKDVIRALEKNMSLEIEYVGAKRGDSAQRRLIDPIKLCFVSERWHLHAFCHTKKAGRDFLLYRIMKSYGLRERRTPGMAESVRRMNQEIPLTVLPHPDLTVDQRHVIKRKFGIENGKTTIRLPAHLLFYFRKSYIADLSQDEGPPTKFLVEE